MKVVHLNTSDRGGAAVAAIQLHLALLERSVDSHLLTLVRTRHDIPSHHQVHPFELKGRPLLDRLRYKARRLLETTRVVEDRSNTPDNRYLRHRPAGHEIFTLPYAWFSVLDHPLVQQADVLHLHWVGYGMVDHRDLFTRWRKKFVWTLHDMNPITAGSHHTDDDESYTTGPDRSPQVRDHSKAVQYWHYKQQALAHVPKERLQLVAPSRWLAQRTEASAMMRGRSCAVVPNGCDTNVFRPMDRAEARRRAGLPLDRKVVLFNAVDLDNPRKGMPLLLPALRALRTSDVLLVCIGGSPVAAMDGIAVHGTGFLEDPRAIADHFNAADVFVLPSLAENLPNTISESLLCGTPVVAFRVGGIPEQVDASNGILVERGDAVGLSNAIDRALGASWDHTAIAQAAAPRYDRRTVAEQYLTLYPGPVR